MGIAKGYTGQYSNPLTGLDYYVSRYYDPVAGIFLSADTKEGNAQGMNPYAYVAQNPETLTDPSGQYFAPPGGNGNGDPNPPSCQEENDCNKVHIDYPDSPPTHTKTVKVECNAICQYEKNAQQNAANAAAFFSNLANDLTNLENLLNMTDLENLLSLKSLFGKYGSEVMGYVNIALGGVATLASPQYAGLLIALPRLVSIAQDLASGFAAEANHPLKWFTVQNVVNDWWNVQGPPISDALGSMALSAGVSLAGVGVAAFTDGAAAEIGASLINASGTSAGITSAGTIIMEFIAEGYLETQEDILAGPPPPGIHYMSK
jgi:RHS repeat-associated protein